MKRLSLLLLLLLPSTALLAGDAPLYNLSQFPPGVYKMTVSADGVKFESLTIITPVIGGDPIPNPTSGLKAVVVTATAKVPQSQTKDFLRSALSIVCKEISKGLTDKSIDIGQAADRWATAQTLVSGEPEWAAWLTTVKGKLSEMQLADQMETAAQWSTAFSDIAAGLTEGGAGLGDILAKLIALFEGLDPAKLQKWIDTIKLLISLFGG